MIDDARDRGGSVSDRSRKRDRRSLVYRTDIERRCLLTAADIRRTGSLMNGNYRALSKP